MTESPNIIHHSPYPSPDGLSKIVLLLNAFLPAICFYFFTQQYNIGSLVLFTWGIVILLSVPSAMALNKPHLIPLSYWTTLLTLLAVILSTSVNLWQNLLQGQNILLVNHLLTLLFSLLLASALQMHLIRFNKPNHEQSSSEKVQRLFQGPSLIISLIIAMILVNILLIILHSANEGIFVLIANKFLTRGIIPPLTLLLFFWGLILIIGKCVTVYIDMVKRQSQTLRNLYFAHKSKESKDKLLDLCWQQLDSFYTIPKYINWAIPILGFIGTVLGISLATEGLSDLLATSESNYSQLLSEALSPLGIAFDTTLIALTLSVLLTLIQTLVARWEEKLLSQFEQKPER